MLAYAVINTDLFMLWMYVQVRQLRGEVSHMEAESGGLQREIHSCESTIAKSAVKQQALQLQKTMAQLEAEKAAVQAVHEQLADPQASVAAMQAQAQRETATLEALKAQVKELQAAVKEKEDSLAGLRSTGANGAGCNTFSATAAGLLALVLRTFATREPVASIATMLAMNIGI